MSMVWDVDLDKWVADMDIGIGMQVAHVDIGRGQHMGMEMQPVVMLLKKHQNFGAVSLVGMADFVVADTADFSVVVGMADDLGVVESEVGMVDLGLVNVKGMVDWQVVNLKGMADKKVVNVKGMAD